MASPHRLPAKHATAHRHPIAPHLRSRSGRQVGVRHFLVVQKLDLSAARTSARPGNCCALPRLFLRGCFAMTERSLARLPARSLRVELASPPLKRCCLPMAFPAQAFVLLSKLFYLRALRVDQLLKLPNQPHQLFVRELLRFRPLFFRVAHPIHPWSLPRATSRVRFYTTRAICQLFCWRPSCQ